MLYYFEYIRSTRLFKLHANSDSEAIDKAKAEAERVGDSLLCVWTDNYKQIWNSNPHMPNCS